MRLAIRDLLIVALALLLPPAARAGAGPSFDDLAVGASLLGVPSAASAPQGAFDGRSTSPLPGLPFLKRFDGGGGEVRMPPLPFAVARFRTRALAGGGLALDYDRAGNPPPLSWIVDELEPDGRGGWNGRTFLAIPRLGRLSLMTFTLAPSGKM